MIPAAAAVSIDVNTLQWGRNFIVAEICHWHKQISVLSKASMGPQLYRCGNREPSVNQTLSCTASMGPQLYRCGNADALAAALARAPRFNGAATLSLRKSNVMLLLYFITR